MENQMNPGMPVQSHKSGMATMSIGLLLVGLIAGYFIGKSMSSDNVAQQTATPTSMSSVSVSPVATISPVASGVQVKKYTNEEYDFSFEYPTEYLIKVNTIPSTNNFTKRAVVVKIDTPANFARPVGEGTEGYPSFLNIGASEYHAEKDEPKSGCEDSNKTGTITISGHAVDKCEGTTMFGGKSLRLIWTLDGVVYYSIMSDLYSGNNKTTIDQVISTFRLTQ